MKPTITEVQDEVLKLRAMIHLVTPKTMFGEDNRAAIQTQIDLLQGNLPEEFILDGEGYCYDLAMQAFEWMEGLQELKPSDDWRPLCSKIGEA